MKLGIHRNGVACSVVHKQHVAFFHNHQLNFFAKIITLRNKIVVKRIGKQNGRQIKVPCHLSNREIFVEVRAAHSPYLSYEG